MSETPEPIGLSRLFGEAITLCGKTYRLAPLDLEAYAEIERWVFSKLPDPIAVAKEVAKDLPTELAQAVLLEAYHDVRLGARKLGSPEAAQVLQTFEGFREQLYFLGRKHQPEMVRDDWGKILLEAAKLDLALIADRLKESEGGAVPDPKAASSVSPKTDDLPTGDPFSGSSATG